MFEMPEEERVNLGKPTISELISILSKIMEKYGDIQVAGAYDGNWEEDVRVQYFENSIIIGSIS